MKGSMRVRGLYRGGKRLLRCCSLARKGADDERKRAGPPIAGPCRSGDRDLFVQLDGELGEERRGPDPCSVHEVKK